ncbi:MAG: signal peptide peptidase SppA [Congregibacter sp.]
MIMRILRGLWRAITVTRTLLANLLFLGVLFLIWSAVSGTKPEPLPERAALLVKPIGRVVDSRTRVPTASFLVEADAASSEVVLSDLIDSVDLAATDPRITALVLELDQLVSIGLSKSSEFAEAITRFRDTGKPVVATGSYYSQDQYRLAVEADTILMPPYGALALEGFSFYGNYFAEALEKLSLTMHVFRAGEFKSIAEPLQRNDMSAGEREITRAWLKDLWGEYTASVETRRGLAKGDVDALLSNYPSRLREVGGNAARLALEAGLVDRLAGRQETQRFLVETVGAVDKEGAAATVAFEAYLARARQGSRTVGMPNVAVVSAQGNMLPGDQPPGAIGGDSLSRTLRETAARKDTRAIVLRINSGGGSVFASEVIRREMAQIRAAGTPIVVSMGSVAASGAYYIATAADRILATPTTLTGSIGVFAAFPTAERLLQRGGIHTDGIGTTPIAGGLRPDRPLAPEIKDALQQSVEDMYEQFLGLVMDSRNMDRAKADSLAQGRVMSGMRAMKVGLVDELGGLQRAISSAAEIAGLQEGAYEVIELEPEFSPRDQLLQQLNDSLNVQAKMWLGDSPLAGLISLWAEQDRQSGWLDQLTSLSTDPRHIYMMCLRCAP